MKVIICFRVTHQLSLLLGPHRRHWNRKWGLPSCQCLPVNMLKGLANDTTLLLGIRTALSRYHPTAIERVNQYFHISLLDTENRCDALGLIRSRTPPRSLLVFLCWNLVFPACHSCHVFLLSPSAHTATKTGLKPNGGINNVTQLGLASFLMGFFYYYYYYYCTRCHMLDAAVTHVFIPATDFHLRWRWQTLVLLTTVINEPTGTRGVP